MLIRNKMTKLLEEVPTDANTAFEKMFYGLNHFLDSHFMHVSSLVAEDIIPT